MKTSNTSNSPPEFNSPWPCGLLEISNVTAHDLRIIWTVIADMAYDNQLFKGGRSES